MYVTLYYATGRRTEREALSAAADWATYTMVANGAIDFAREEDMTAHDAAEWEPPEDADPDNVFERHGVDTRFWVEVSAHVKAGDGWFVA